MRERRYPEDMDEWIGDTTLVFRYRVYADTGRLPWEKSSNSSRRIPGLTKARAIARICPRHVKPIGFFERFIRWGSNARLLHLHIHNTLLHQLSNVRVLPEAIVLCTSALHLTQGSAMDKLPDHVKFAPVNFVGVIRVRFRVALVSPNEIRHVHFQSGYASTLGALQSHSICTVGFSGLEKDIPGSKCFEQIRRPCFEELHSGVRCKCGIVDTGDECP